MIRYEEIQVDFGKYKIAKEIRCIKYLEDKEGIKLTRTKIAWNELGVPDCFYLKDDKLTFVEFKTNNCGVTKEQFMWLLANQDKNIRVIWFSVRDNRIEEFCKDFLKQAKDLEEGL